MNQENITINQDRWLHTASGAILNVSHIIFLASIRGEDAWRRYGVKPQEDRPQAVVIAKTVSGDEVPVLVDTEANCEAYLFDMKDKLKVMTYNKSEAEEEYHHHLLQEADQPVEKTTTV